MTEPLTRQDDSSVGVYEVDTETVQAMYKAMGSGKSSLVLRLGVGLLMGIRSYEIERLTLDSQWYSPLESNGDALTSLVQSHDGGVIPLEEWMRKFLAEAEAQMKAAGKPLSSDIADILEKIRSAQDLSESEGKALYAWCLEAKELVIPAEHRASVTTEQMKRLQDEFTRESEKFASLMDAVTPR